MPVREIPREQWVSFFNQFSESHAGWLVYLEEVGKRVGTEVEIDNVPLGGINADLKDGEQAITISLGSSSRDSGDHVIEGVTHVRLTQSAENDDEELEIEAKDGTITLIRVQATAAGGAGRSGYARSR
ncbi:MAG TPA: DUF5335 family protein [Aggregatilineales bacterium]|nr:DUF5335 family protein [Aggregatilineales bacterium]